MHIRSFNPHDLSRLVELTIQTFRPYYEDHYRPLVGERIFEHQHGDWAQDYQDMVPGLHDPAAHKFVAVAESDGVMVGYVGYHVDPARRDGRIEILAVDASCRRRSAATALCEHAFAAMRDLGIVVVEIGTGADAFHAPARAFYESLGCIHVPVAAYVRQL